MSFRAVNFSLKQQMDRSSDKFLLLCIANYAQDDGTAYPSQLRLQADTCLDRKTVCRIYRSWFAGAGQGYFSVYPSTGVLWRGCCLWPEKYYYCRCSWS